MTDSTLEPTNVGPMAGGHLRASDADRDQVATLLSAAYAEGRLSREEHDERLGAVLAAKTFDDLLPVTRDLVPLGPAAAAARPLPAVPSDAAYTIDTRGPSAESDKMVAVFGGVSRKGRWRVRKQTQALALFGGMDLDMREALFEDPVVEITGFWCFGGLDIKVPAGVEVRDQTAGVFGGTDVKDLGDRVDGAPTIVLKGMTLFGGVSVSGPKRPKVRR